MLQRNAEKRIVATDGAGSSRRKGRAPGMALVAPQFALIACMAWPSHDGGWSWTGAVLLVAGALLGFRTLRVNRPGNFNIRAEIKPSAKLVLVGPYRAIRHPMYSGLLLLMSGITFFNAESTRWIALASLAAVLFAKSFSKSAL